MQPPGGGHEPLERRVVERPDAGERGDALDPEDLVLVDVADAGERPLVEERDADLQLGARRVAQPAMHLGGIEVGRQQVRPELRQRRVEVLGPRSRTARRPGRRSRPRPRRRPRARGGPGRAVGASARRADSGATSRSSAGGSGSARPPSNRISRFLPCDSTASMRLPTIRWTCGTGPGPGPGPPARPARRGTAAGRRRCGRACRLRAWWRWLALPGAADGQAAIAGTEPGRERAGRGTATPRRAGHRPCG